MKLPNIVCLGAAKSGTTSLQSLFSRHPEIFVPLKKDFHYFDRDEVYQKGLQWYSDIFREADSNTIADVAADYLFSSKAPKRIYRDLGKDIKLIVMMRNPVDRAFSEYKHYKRNSLIKDREFEYFFSIEKNRDFINKEDSWINFFSRGFYTHFISNYLKYFNINQFHFVIFEDFIKNQQRVLNDICYFLGTENLNLDDPVETNKSFIPRYKILQKLIHQQNPVKNIARKIVPSFKMRQKIRHIIRRLNRIDNNSKSMTIDTEFRNRVLKDVYREDIEKLSDLISTDLYKWWR